MSLNNKKVAFISVHLVVTKPQQIAMREYDSTQPLIVIHVPKTAGTSIEQIFKGWFGEQLLRHYPDEVNGKLPKKYDLLEMHSKEKPIVVYGHFNKLRHFGIKDYYPEVKQFITILRDPFETAVSGYFFLRKAGVNWKDQSRIPREELKDFLLKKNPNMLNHFPTEITMDNYKEVIESQFIEVGITEKLNESMQQIAKKLNVNFDPSTLERRNVTERDQKVPYELREEFMQRNPLEYAVYQYVLDKYAAH